jgi:succinate-semialdehyde dehydrogenase/glutarate-semialdehyde dehydrogenase
MTLQSINPTNGETFATYHEWPPRQVQDEIGRVHEAYLEWRWTSFDDRAAVMRKAAETLRDNASSYARLMAQEMGKPLRDGIAEAQKCATACDFYAEHAAHFLEREYVSTQARLSFVTFKPLGVVLAVMPWNFRSGRSSALRPRTSWPATPPCSSTPRTCRVARSPSKRCSATRASRSICSAPS